MIKLEVEDYCQNCLEFEPDVDKPTTYYAGSKRFMFPGDTMIRCEHRERCREIARFIAVTNTNKEQTE